MSATDKIRIDQLKNAIVRHSRENPNCAKNYVAGEDIIAQGDLGDSLYLITSGTASILIESDHDTKEVALRTVNDIVGETGFLNRNVPRTATVRVVSPTATAVKVSRDEVFSIIAHDPSLTDAAVSLWDLGNARAIESHSVLTGEFFVRNKLVTAVIGDIHNFSSVSNAAYGEYADTFLFEFIEICQDLSDQFGTNLEDQGDGFKVIFEDEAATMSAVSFGVSVIDKFEAMRTHWTDFDSSFEHLGLGIGAVTDFMSIRSRKHLGQTRRRIVSHSINIASAMAKYRKKPWDTNFYIDPISYNFLKSKNEFHFEDDSIFFENISAEVTMYKISLRHSDPEPLSVSPTVTDTQSADVSAIDSENTLAQPQHPGSEDCVFLCHNSQDKPYVRKLNEVLKEGGVKTWLDEEQIAPGDMWQEELERSIAQVKGCLIIVGDSGLGPWQDHERRAFINELANRGCKIVPILIGEGQVIPELPLMLRQSMWVDLRVNEALGITRIIKAFEHLK